MLNCRFWYYYLINVQEKISIHFYILVLFFSFCVRLFIPVCLIWFNNIKISGDVGKYLNTVICSICIWRFLSFISELSIASYLKANSTETFLGRITSFQIVSSHYVSSSLLERIQVRQWNTDKNGASIPELRRLPK